MPADALIVVKDLVHTYPNGVQALRGVNLSIQQGEFCAIVGQNGSGKTTLAKHFNGLLKPSQGNVRVAGHNTAQTRVSEMSRLAGYVFQNPDDMLFCSSVEEEIAFGPRMLHFSEAEIKQRTEKAIEALELKALSTQHPFALSLGDRQRVAVACMLSLDPDTFIFDEPTTGQDHLGASSIMAVIQNLHANGRTIIIITHDMRLVAEYADRVIVMSQGQVMLDAPPAIAFKDYDLLAGLSLRPPQVTRLASLLGCQEQAILKTDEFCSWLDGKSVFNSNRTGTGVREA